MNNKLLKSFFSLGGVQAINLLIPLLISPFVISRVGLTSFGLISIAQVFGNYGNILTNYGFQVTAVREIATLEEGNIQELSRVFSKYFFCTLLLLVICLFLLAGVLGLISQDLPTKLIYGSSAAIIFSQSLLPIWFFQGINQVKHIVFPTLFGRMLAICLIFLFIEDEQDAPYVNLFLGFGNTLSALLLLYGTIKKKYFIKLNFPGFEVLIQEIQSGFYLFLSNISVNIYNSSGILFLGYLTSPVWVGVFAICDRIIQLARSILGFFFQATYPFVCQSATQGRNSLKLFFLRTYPQFGLMIFVGCSFLFFFPNLFAGFFVKGSTVSLVESSLRNYSFVPFIVAVNIPFYQTLLVYLQDKLYAKILIFFSIISLFFYGVGIFYFGINGLIGSIYLIEIGVTFSLVYFATTFFERNEFA